MSELQQGKKFTELRTITAADAQRTRLHLVLPDDASPEPDEDVLISLPDFQSIAQQNTLNLQRASGIINSWWTTPTSIYNGNRMRVYQSGVDRGGAFFVGYFDLRAGGFHRHYVAGGSADDHHAPAMLIPNDRPPIVVYRYASGDQNIRFRKGVKPHALETLGEEQIAHTSDWGISYPHILRKPGTDTIGIFYLSYTGDQPRWWMIKSDDYGDTWGEPVEMLRKHYVVHRQFGDVAHFLSFTHPASTGGAEVRYFNVNLSTGVIYNRTGGASENNWWDATEGVVVSHPFTNNVNSPPGRIRGFDVASNGSALLGLVHDINNPELGMTYVVRRHVTGNTWTTEALTESGKPFGYNVSLYVGGMTFGQNSSEVFLIREENDVWYLERWTRSAGTWSRAAVLRQQSGKMGRVWNPNFGEAQQWLLYGDYHMYPVDQFNDYDADRILINKNVSI